MRGQLSCQVRGLWRTAMAVALAGVTSIVTATAAYAQSGDSSKSGDLAGNLPVAIYLLIPLGLAFAFLTAVALGERGEPQPGEQRAGGITRALGRRRSDDRGAPDRGAPDRGAPDHRAEVS